MTSLSDDTRANIIEAFDLAFRYLEDPLNIDNSDCRNGISN